jgi:hypothetical protein
MPPIFGPSLLAEFGSAALREAQIFRYYEQRIMSALGVPKELLGEMKNTNRAREK